jgi:hypothetical protein
MCTSSPPRSSRYQTWTDRSSPHYVRNAHDFRLKSHAFFFARDASRAIGLLFEAAGSVGSASGTLLAFQSEQLTRRGSFVTSSRHETFNARSLVHRKFKLPLDPLRLAEPEALAEILCIVRRAADVTGVGLSELNSLYGDPRTNRDLLDTDKPHAYGERLSEKWRWAVTCVHANIRG